MEDDVAAPARVFRRLSVPPPELGDSGYNQNPNENRRFVKSVGPFLVSVLVGF